MNTFTIPPFPPPVPVAPTSPPLTVSQAAGDIDRAASPKDYANAMPAALLHEHRAAVTASMGLDDAAHSHDMLTIDGQIAAFTEQEHAAVGDMPAVHARHMGPTARARLSQIAENPQLIYDYLSSGVSTNQLAALLDMTVAGMEAWFDRQGYMEYYAQGRSTSADIYAENAEAALSEVPDLSGDVNDLVAVMEGADPNDNVLMELIRMKEWRMGVLKAGAEYALKRSKLRFEGYMKMAASIAPQRYAPRKLLAETQQGSIAFNIILDSSEPMGAGSQVINNKTGLDLSQQGVSTGTGIIIDI